MAITIITQQQDEQNPGLWHFKIAGPAAGGETRLADLSQVTTSPADWLAANGAAAQAAIDAGTISDEFNERVDFRGLKDQIDSELTYINTTLGTIDTMTAAQVRDVVKRLLQEQRQELKAWKYVIRRLVG